MGKIVEEYQRYQASVVMKMLASYAHGSHYEGQTSSATFEEIHQLLQKLDLPSQSTLLDLGCGNGSFAIKICEYFNYKVIGVDLSSVLIEIAKEQAIKKKLNDSINFLVDDFTHLNNLSEVQCDCLLSIGSLYWNQPLKMTLNTWKNRLRNQGYLVIFSNLKLKELTSSEQKSIGETSFISLLEFQQLLQELNFKKIFWENQTSTYIAWLTRWCNAMKISEREIQQDMGLDHAKKLVHRFETYLSLAIKAKVSRDIIIMQKE